MIKIGLCGVHGSGKTTLANKLREQYINEGNTAYVVTEVARNCPYELGTINAQEYIWHKQMMRERHAMKLGVDVAICDRTVMDNLMYYRYILDHKGNTIENYLPNAVRWWDLYDEAKEWMRTYDQVIRLPLNLEYLKADDPIRPKDEAYAIRIDALFDEFVEQFVTEVV